MKIDQIFPPGGGLNLREYPNLKREKEDEVFISEWATEALLAAAQLPVSWEAFHSNHDNVN